jgi:signal transduction histidine kinase/CheY-like chemotaxis protein/HPt (histidine-containing phosphotransfer) domain-containing protein
MSVFYPPGEITPDALDQRLAAALESGFAHDEGWRVRKDGSRFWASVTITPMHDDEGQITGYSKITRDLTEKRAQEIELKRLVGVQTAILDNAGVAIITTDMKGFITLFNPSAERLLGYRSDEVIGKLTPAAFHDRDEIAEKARALSEELGVPVKPGLATLGAKALRGEVDTSEWTYVAKSGQRKPVLLSVTGIFDEAGTPLGTVGLAADLTEQKRYQTELVSARVAAERANMAKSSFLANMSHEIRTPMNAILGMTQLVLQGPLDPQQRSLLEKAFAASKALLNILNDVLDYSKVEAGHMLLEVRELSLETLLANAASLFAHQAEQKGLEFILDIPPDLPTQVLGDPLRLTQVLSNLLSNALKFTSEGSVTLSARTERTSAQMCRVRFSIADSGIGMNRSQIAQLFKPFTQADASVTRKYGGTGLGLSICKRLVELMGGAIEVRSTPGQGSEFFFDIDMALPVTDVYPPKKPSRLPFQRALIVDDQIAAAHVLHVMLHSWKVDSSCCDSAAAAVEELKQAMASGRPFDLVVTDWQMPEMDGLGLVDRIQQLVARGSLPHMPTIVMVSMYAQEDLVEQLRGRPIAALLSKPVLPSALLNALTGTAYEKAGLQLASPGVAATYNNYISAAAPLRGKRILLAEDNEVNQQVATAFLQSAGLEVSVACNGLQAVEMAQSAQFAAILMDMHMPEMDGLEATRQIRSIPTCATTPIIAMTAAVMQEDKKACFDAGMDDFVGKPIEPEELIGALRKWAGTAASAHPVVSQAKVATMSDADRALDYLKHIEGLEISSAIARMGGDRDLFLRLLQGFSGRANSLAEQLETLPVHDFASLAHKLKGECANLGLTLMASSCADLESALKQQPEQRPAEAISVLCKYLRAFSAQMVQTVPAPPRISDGARIENIADEYLEEIVTLLDQLPALLKEQRMQALKHSDRLQEILKDTRWQIPYLLVHSQISQLQFAAASGALREFRPAFDASLR